MWNKVTLNRRTVRGMEKEWENSKWSLRYKG